MGYRKRLQRSGRAKGWRFDVQGLLLFCAFILPVMFALERAQRLTAESVPVVAALFGLAAVALVVLIRHEKSVETPLLPIQLFRLRAIWMSNLMVLCQGAMLTSLITFLPIYLRVLRGGSPSEAAWLLLPITFGLSIGSIVSGRLMSFTGRTMVIPSITLVPGSLSLIDFAFASPGMSLGHMAVQLGITAILLGSVMSVVQVSIQSAAGPHMLGAAAGSVQFSRSVGAAFGTALFATALFATLTIRDPAAADYFTKILDVGPQVLDALEPARRQTIRDEIQTAFQFGFMTAASFTVLCLVLAWINPQRRV